MGEEDRLSEELVLAGMVSDLRAWASSVQPRPRDGKYVHNAQTLFLAVEVAKLLKSEAAGLREVCLKALAIVDPRLSRVCQPTLDRLPSATTVRRHMLTLDMAYLMLEQVIDQVENELPHQERPAWYGLADSSPLWGSEWLWNAHFGVRGGAQLLFCHGQAQQMIVSLLEYQHQHRDDADIRYWDDMAAMPNISRTISKALCRHMWAHTHTPVVVASGYSGLSHKISGTLHSYFLGRPDIKRLGTFLDTFVSFTFVEFGVQRGICETGDNQDRGGDAQFDHRKFTTTIQSPLFWLQLDTVLAIEGVVGSASS